ncbi:MAG: CopD family protein [Caldilineaceae bacterium]|jgi:putative copper export protein|nr:CopD family protein [Caldilineaceae bacterium]
MSSDSIVLALVIFLHDLFTAIWVGGLITLGLTVLPAAKKMLAGAQTRQFMDAILQRQSVLVYISILGLVVTGAMQANRTPAFQGLFGLGNAYTTALTVKHILVAVMIVVALLRSLGLRRRSTSPSPFQEKLSIRLLFLNLLLGVAVLLLSGFMAALASA